MTPSVGRVVHYSDAGADPIAGIITGVNKNGTVALCLFFRGGHLNKDAVPYSEKPAARHWNWPPRVA